MKYGDYIRTDKGYIEKIKNFIPHHTKGKRLGKSEEVVENYLLMGTKQCELIENIDYSIPPCYPSDEELEKIKKHIVKHSSNIIDLIEVGDYVNGSLVLDNVANMYLLVSSSDFNNNKIFDYMIKSIVTKENFKNNSYKVVE